MQYVTMESNWQSTKWTVKDEKQLKRQKTKQLAGKSTASVFCDAHAILFIDYLEKRKTISFRKR